MLEGGKGTEYEGGVYHGIMQFPPAYPYRPPSLQMLTPSGRFAVGQKICLSNTDYHAETWCARLQTASLHGALQRALCGWPVGLPVKPRLPCRHRVPVCGLPGFTGRCLCEGWEVG